MSNVYYLDDYRQGVQSNTTESTAEKSTLLEKADEALRLGDRVAACTFLLEYAALSRREIEDFNRRPNKLQIAVPIVLYFVSWGRNAWHSTWISRYQKKSLMANYSEACEYIGRKSTQGTVFRITIIPGWYLGFLLSRYLVCEINTDAPFSRLTRATFADLGVLEADALRELEPESSIWRGASPLHDSVIVQQTDRKVEEFTRWTEAEESNEIKAHVRSFSKRQRPREYSPEDPGDYGMYVRDASSENGLGFAFRPSSKGGPDQFNCDHFRRLIGGIDN